jgi:hypothetical protein
MWPSRDFMVSANSADLGSRRIGSRVRAGVRFTAKLSGHSQLSDFSHSTDRGSVNAYGQKLSIVSSSLARGFRHRASITRAVSSGESEELD